MIIGLPKEIKDNESRVGMTPGAVKALTRRGHRVLVETDAGAGSSLPDSEYEAAGAEIVATAADAWSAQMVVKVKEPIAREYPFLRPDLILFTYLHLAADRALTDVLLESGTTAIAYETVQTEDGKLPLLMPMSEVAGRMATQIGATYLQRTHGGRGVLMGGVPGVAPANVAILGGGTVGANAARVAVGLGAQVTVLEMGRALAKADAAHAQLATGALRSEGVTILEGHKAARVSGEAGRLTVHAEGPQGEVAVEGSHILVALGRRAVLDGLDLDKGKVDHTPAGITVSDTLRSRSNPRVWALGDAAGREQFTHVAGWHASVFIRRAFFKQGSTAASLPIPSVTYTSPEIAQIGLTEAEARAKFGEAVKSSAFPFHDNDRAIAEGKTLGEAKLVLHKGKLVGASIAGDGAGDILQVVSLAMSNGLKLTALTNFISPYPTRAEVVKRAASAYFTPSVFGKPARTLVGLLQRIP